MKPRVKMWGVLLSVLMITLFGVAVAATPASASNPACGAVTLSGNSWLGGNGVDVHSNGNDTGTGTSCGGSTGVYNLSATTPQMGLGWQCVELVQRLYDTRGWYSGGSFGFDYAYQIYDNAATLGFTSQANGSITSIVPGDMVVQGTGDTYSPTAGHVDVVDSVNGTTVNIVQQNSSSATTTYTLSSDHKTLSGASGGDILGIVHSPANTSAGGSAGGTPPPDTDGDGVPDGQDQCPTVPAPSQPDGCPADSPSSSEAVQLQSSGMTQVFVQGPNNSLQTYWWTPNVGWAGPYQLAGANTTYSEPMAVQNQTSGQVQVFVQGPNNTLKTYYWSPNVGWNSYQIASSGTTYSEPGAVQLQSSGMTQVFVQGPNNSLQTYWWTPNVGWAGPYQLATTAYSVPTAVQNQTTGMVQVFVQGASNSLQTYYWSPGVGWASYQIASSGTTYSDAGPVQLQSSGMTQVFVQGPNNTLKTYYWSPNVGWNSYQIASSGSKY